MTVHDHLEVPQPGLVLAGRVSRSDPHDHDRPVDRAGVGNHLEGSTDHPLDHRHRGANAYAVLVGVDHLVSNRRLRIVVPDQNELVPKGRPGKLASLKAVGRAERAGEYCIV